MRSLSQRATASLSAETSEEVWLILLTINHASLASPIRLVNNIEDVISNGQTYIGLPFDIELPDEGSGPAEARIRIDNVSKQIVEALRAIQEPPTVMIDVILADQPDAIEFRLTGFVLRDAQYDALSVSGALRLEEISVEPVAELITPERFPGLF